MPDDLQRAFREILIRETYKALEKSGLVGAAVIVHDERLRDDSREFAQCLADKLNRDLEAAFYEEGRLAAREESWEVSGTLGSHI